MSDEQILKELTEKLKKALTASVTSSLMRRDKLTASAPKFEAPNSITEVTVIGSNGRYNSFEPVIMPSEVIQAPQEITKSERFKSCITCGGLQKSNTPCNRCDSAHNVKESIAYHKR
jgi:hypothetical protein